MNTALLSYYEAIEQASADMLDAARAGDWDQVVKLEGACVLLISQLKHAARERTARPDEAQLKSRIMQRILVNDAEIRHLAEPWLDRPRRHAGRQAADAALTPTRRHDAMFQDTRPAALGARRRHRCLGRVPRRRSRARSLRCCSNCATAACR